MNFNTIIKNIKKDSSTFKKIKLAVLGDTSTQFLCQALKGFAHSIKINLEIYEADHNRIDPEIINHDACLYVFQPDFVFIQLSTSRLLSEFYKVSLNERNLFAEQNQKKIQTYIDTINSGLKTKIIINNYIEINDGIFGNFSNKINSSFIFQLRKLNFELMNIATSNKNFFVNDLQTLAINYGSDNIFDLKLHISADLEYHLDFLPAIAKNTFDIICALAGNIKKCIILDLDNTLWQGIVGDDGIENIQIGELGIGKAFREFQQWLKELKQRGIILAVCSKNTEVIAKEPFEKHPEMVLRLDDISVFVANWENKVDNIKYIQKVLSISFDSMVFIDDNPFERNLIRNTFPDITVPEIPEDPSEYVAYLRKLNLFETANFSNEDINRTRQYQDEAKRSSVMASFINMDDYLKILKMEAEIKSFDPFSIPRIAQLTQRSNQFNLRTIRYTEADISHIKDSSQYISKAFYLKDNFGNYGLISVIILKKIENELFIDTWIMSCRVLKRNVEEFILNEMVKIALENNFSQITGEYIPTQKNGIVKNLFLNLGFSQNGNTWILDLKNFKPLKNHINVRQ